MSQNIPTGFFAYPSNPPLLGETIRAAVEVINDGGFGHGITWENLTVGGRVIIQEIFRAIDDAQFFCVDLTGLNQNVMFELGYAIARNKPIFPILDNSFPANKNLFDQLRILTTVGYTPYQNHRQIVDGFYREQPYRTTAPTLFEQLIQPNLQTIVEEKLLYLKSRIETEASVKITRRISRSPIPQTIDDPREVTVQYLPWYGTNIHAAACIVCHLMHPERDGAVVHNARFALVAGMAVGMGKRLLMLREGEHLAPLDYREILVQYTRATEVETRLDEWLRTIEQSWLEAQTDRRGYMAEVTLAAELQNLQIGDPLAENEAENLIEYYFIETVAYDEALEGKQTIFVGRKGTGKSANFIKLADELGSDKRNLAVTIKPIAYELQGIADLLARYSERDYKTYAIESLWKFLLLSEIANAVARLIRERPVPELNMDDDEAALIALMERDDQMLSRDFSVRLERCVDALRAAQHNRSGERSIEQDQLVVSQALHEGIYSELRIVLGRILSNKKRVAILVDNLDKAWDRNSDLTYLAEFFLGLLSAARRLTRDFRRDDSRRDYAYVTVAIFLRSDIFYKIKSVAREPDKINSYRLSWDDPELLLRVIEERFVALHAGNIQPDEVWARYFCETVKGRPTKQYFFEHTLPRPRDLVYFVKAAVATAVNRRHPRVEETDILDAEKQYSQFAIESLMVESDLPVVSLEPILYEFIVSPSHLSLEQVREAVSKAGVPQENIDIIIDGLCTMRFLGIEVADGDFRFADDPQEFKRFQIMSRKLGERREQSPQFMINPAYWAFLEVSNGEATSH